MSFRITLLISPIPKGRPRFSVVQNRKTQKQRVFARTPPRTEKFENALREAIVLSLNMKSTRYPLYKKPLAVAADFDFIFPRPKNRSRKKDPFGYIWKPSLPDIDNLQKAVCDAMNGVLWEDDSQIVDLRSRKLYADKKKGREGAIPGPNTEPCISIFVREVNETPAQELCSNAVRDRLDFEDLKITLPLFVNTATALETPMQEGEPVEAQDEEAELFELGQQQEKPPRQGGLFSSLSSIV